MSGLFGGVSTTRLLVTGMDLAQQNHHIIANNIANSDTPGYNGVQMDFDKSLRSALKGRGGISLRKTRPLHFNGGRSRISHKSLVVHAKNDYNKVDVEEEISNLSKNRGRYMLFGSILVKQFQMTKSMLQNAR